MKKIKDIVLGILAVIGSLFLFFKLKESENPTSGQSLEKDKNISQKETEVLLDAKYLDNQAKKLDNVTISEDEEWYKKR